MIYLLDTNTCIGYLNGRAPRILTRLQALLPSQVAVCSVVKAELFFGAQRSQNPTRTLARQVAFLRAFVSLPFDDAAAEQYGYLRVHLARLGTPIGPNDLLIAAIALANDLTLVTRNLREFERVPSLRLENRESGA